MPRLAKLLRVPTPADRVLGQSWPPGIAVRRRCVLWSGARHAEVGLSGGLSGVVHVDVFRYALGRPWHARIKGVSAWPTASPAPLAYTSMRCLPGSGRSRQRTRPLRLSSALQVPCPGRSGRCGWAPGMSSRRRPPRRWRGSRPRTGIWPRRCVGSLRTAALLLCRTARSFAAAASGAGRGRGGWHGPGGPGEA